MNDRFQHMFRSILKPFFKSLVSPSTNIQKNVDRWKNLTNTRRPHQKLLVSPSFSVAWKETEKAYFSGSSSTTTSSLTRWKAVWQGAELRFLEMHSSVHPSLGVAASPPAPQKYPLPVAFRWEGEKPCVSIFLRGGSSFFVICDATMTPKK